METLIKTFKQFILEGGNVIVTNQDGEEIAADRIDLRKINRTFLKKVLIDFFFKLDDLFYQKYHKHIWNNRDYLFKSGVVFNGSSEHFFNNEINDEVFVQVKSSLGDIDITVPEELKEDMFEFLNSLRGAQINNYISFINHNKQKITNRTDQINALFNYNDGKIDFNFQVDFEFLEYENDEPHEFSKFGHSSHWEDLSQGLKGVHHKYLMRALTTSSNILKNVVEVTPSKLQVKKQQKDIYGLYKFNINKGVRAGYTIHPTLEINGKKAIIELKTKDSKYTKNLLEIGRIIFGYNVPENELKQEMWSFIGLIRLMKKYLMKEQIINTVKILSELYWGENAQELVRDNPEEDYNIKLAGWEILEREFPFATSVINLDKTIENYYKDYGKYERIDEKIRVADISKHLINIGKYENNKKSGRLFRHHLKMSGITSSDHTAYHAWKNHKHLISNEPQKQQKDLNQ